MKNIIKLAAVGLLALAPSAALAGKGGSATAIQAAMASGSSDANRRRARAHRVADSARTASRSSPR